MCCPCILFQAGSAAVQVLQARPAEPLIIRYGMAAKAFATCSAAAAALAAFMFHVLGASERAQLVNRLANFDSHPDLKTSKINFLAASRRLCEVMPDRSACCPVLLPVPQLQMSSLTQLCLTCVSCHSNDKRMATSLGMLV